MKQIEKEITIEEGDSFKMVLSKYGALGLDKQENLSELIGDTEGDLDLEKGFITFGDIKMPIQVLGFYSQDLNQWSWAWDNEDIFGENLVKAASKIKAVGDEFGIVEFSAPIIQLDYDACHSIAMTATAFLNYDAYYAVSEDGLDIFVAVESDEIKENNSLLKFRNTFYTFQKNFKIYPKLAFEAYTKLKGYRYKPHDDFAVAKIGESRLIVGFTERGNVTRILMYDEEE